VLSQQRQNNCHKTKALGAYLVRLSCRAFIMKMRNLLLTVLTIFFFIGEPLAQDLKTFPVYQNKHTITPEDVLSIRELYEVKLSPNGKQIAFVVTEPNDPKKPREPRTSNIWVVPTRSRALLPGTSPLSQGFSGGRPMAAG
jgi:hypothetical protein